MAALKSPTFLALSPQLDSKHVSSSKSLGVNVPVNETKNNRFGHKSKNMFFVRHAAIPQNLKIITGRDRKIFFIAFFWITS